MSKTTPTQRSLKYLRDRGYTVAVVEKWNSHVGIRQDLWGFADIIAFNGAEVILVQTTTVTNMASRRDKIKENEVAKFWLLSVKAMGHIPLTVRRIELHGWKKPKKSRSWVVTVEDVIV